MSLSEFAKSPMSPTGNMSDFLVHVSPFKYLPAQTRRDLYQRLSLRTYQEGEVIHTVGESYSYIFILKSGKVAIHDNHGKIMFLVNRWGVFGERSSIFSTQHFYTAVASTPAVVYILEADIYRSLIKEHLPFSLAVARNLRHKQQIFTAFDRFQSVLFNGVYNGRLDLKATLECYMDLTPAIHSKINSSTIDIDAWLYVLRRLPVNITSVFTIIMSRKIVNVLEGGMEDSERMEEFTLNTLASSVLTADRRRHTWTLLPGKVFVLLRDATTDVIDFVTCLCVHIVELRKLSRLLKPRFGEVMKVLKANLPPPGQPETEQAKDAVLQALRLMPQESAGLKMIWPDNLIQNIINVLMHHGDYSIMFDQALNNHDTDYSEHWIEAVRSATTELVGDIFDSHPLPIYVISSNTHSVINCVSPYLHAHAEEILEWGRQQPKLAEIYRVPFRHTEDLLYTVAKQYFDANPDKKAERKACEREHGIVIINNESFTGVSVQLLDISRLSRDHHDSRFNFGKTKGLLVNIDYAFGHQAEELLGSLIFLFGNMIKSINVLGKAGGLCGERGDILLATHVILQSQDEMRAIGNPGLDPEVISEISGRTVHVGPVLTVEGTLLQNRVLLQYYRSLWHCIGLEMEGSFYAKQMERSIMLGMLSPEVEVRFLYYVSDTPLDPEATLSKKMSFWEGIPPLYTTTVVILNCLLSEKAPRTSYYDKKCTGSPCASPLLGRSASTEKMVDDHAHLELPFSSRPAVDMSEPVLGPSSQLTGPHAWQKLKWTIKAAKGFTVRRQSEDLLAQQAVAAGLATQRSHVEEHADGPQAKKSRTEKEKPAQ